MRAWLFPLVFAGAVSGQTQNVRPPNETAGFDKIAYVLISEFDHSDIVALGDDHGRKLDSDLRISVVRHTDFVQKVKFIVVEFASTAEQPILDRYIRGEDVPIAQLERVWKTTTQTNGVWDSPVYAKFLASVRDVNKRLPAESRIRVLAGDPPAGSTGSRDDSAVRVLQEGVLSKHAKALLIYGYGHLVRGGPPATGGEITKALESQGARVFVVITLGGPSPQSERFERALRTPVRPVLVSLAELPFRSFAAGEFLDVKKFVNGEWINAFPSSGLTLGELADACVYFGNTPDADKRVHP